MKKIIMTILAGAFTAFAVSAQEIPERKDDGYKPHAKSKMHGKRSMANLNLTEEQKTQFKTLNMEHRKQMEELKKQDNITVKESRERMEKIRKDHKEKFQALLTPDQKEQMKKSREEKGSRDKMTGRSGDKMKAELGLTDEQAAQLGQQRKAIGEQMKAIRENSSLTDEQKKEQMKSLHKKQQEGMKSVLTEEQMKKLKERKGNREGDRKGKPGMKKETI